MNETPWMDARQAALYIGRKSRNAYKTIHRLAKEKKIRAGHDGKTWRFKAEDLDNYLFLSAKEVRQ